MATAVELPQFGTTVAECIITRWVKQKGDAVAAGELVAEIETDKTTFEITAPVAGTMLETFFDEGAVVPVFTRICVIGVDGESADGFRPGHRSGGASAPPYEGGREASAPPRRQGAWTPKPRTFNRPPQERTPSRATRTRAIVAHRMRESLATTAQYTLHSSANATALLAAREQAKQEAPTAAITISDLVAYCTIQALRETPAMNAEFVDGQLRMHEEIHLGFACDTERGLRVPVVHNAHALSLLELSSRMKTLGTRAVDGTISPDDLRGGTFTITNLGSLGIETFTPVINTPQVAILGVGAIQPRPVRTVTGVEFADTILLSLTCDHQVIDGAPGARFLRTLRKYIETVDTDVFD